MKHSILSMAMGGALSLAAFMAPAGVSAAECHSAADIHAMQFRQLQIELMVSALKCEGYRGGLHGKYNQYVKVHGKSLADNAKNLRKAFRNNTTQMDRYISYTSNEASTRSLYIDNYCAIHSELFDMVLSKQPQELDDWIGRSMTVPTSAVACNAAATTTTAVTAPSNTTKVAANASKTKTPAKQPTKGKK